MQLAPVVHSASFASDLALFLVFHALTSLAKLTLLLPLSLLVHSPITVPPSPRPLPPSLPPPSFLLSLPSPACLSSLEGSQWWGRRRHPPCWQWRRSSRGRHCSGSLEWWVSRRKRMDGGSDSLVTWKEKNGNSCMLCSFCRGFLLFFASSSIPQCLHICCYAYLVLPCRWRLSDPSIRGQRRYSTSCTPRWVAPTTLQHPAPTPEKRMGPPGLLHMAVHCSELINPALGHSPCSLGVVHQLQKRSRMAMCT